MPVTEPFPVARSGERGPMIGTTLPSTSEQQVGADFSFKELRDRIHACLEENNLQLKGSWRMWRKAIFIAISWILVYTAIMIYGPRLTGNRERQSA